MDDDVLPALGGSQSRVLHSAQRRKQLERGAA